MKINSCRGLSRALIAVWLQLIILSTQAHLQTANAALVNPSFELGLGGWLHDGNTYPVGTGGNPVGVDGVTVANLGTFNQVGSYLSQSFSVFSGGIYRLHYYLGANGGNSLGRTAAVRLIISSAQGTVLASTISSAISQGPVFGGLGFQPFYLDFSVPVEGAVILVRFDDVSPSNGVSVDPMIDAVRLEAVFPPPGPSITLQPASQTVTEGGSVQFSVTATGGLPMFYQWYKNADPIPGANSASLLLSGVTAAQAGLYWVSIQNSSSIAISEKASLQVLSTGSLIVNGNFEADFQGWEHDQSAVVTWGGSENQKAINLGTFDQKNSFISQSVLMDSCGDYFLSMKLAVNALNTSGALAALAVSLTSNSGQLLFSNVVSLTSSAGSLQFSTHQFQINPPPSSQQVVLRLQDVSPNSGVGVDVVVDEVRMVRIPSHGLDSRIVPATSASVDGTGASAVLSVPIRYQEIYSAAEFGDRPVIISEIRFRPDSRFSSGPFSGFLSRVEVNLATSLRPVGQLSAKFDENYGSDSSLVYAGGWAFNTAFKAAGDSTREFDIVLPLQKPFRYDPKLGNLLVEIKNFSTLPTRFHVDSAIPTAGISRVYADGSPTALFASTTDGSPDVLEFGFCYQTPLPPVIVAQPRDQTVKPGDQATFNVLASGDFPLRFQWYKGVAPLLGRTNASLVIESVSLEDLGGYFVVVSGSGGSTASTLASLRLASAQTKLKITDAAAVAGSRFKVQVDIEANGSESGLGFSLGFDPAVFSFAGYSVGGTLNGVATTINTNQSAQGKIGLAMVLPAGQSLPAGHQLLAEFTLQVAPLVATTSSLIVFADDPVKSEVVDFHANLIETSFNNGTITIGPGGLEGDVSPSAGDGRLTVADWVAMGRLVAGLERPVDELHFRRADCAPRTTLGDGVISIKDWVQSGRFAAGIDSPQPVGGPGSGVQALLASSVALSGSSGTAVLSMASVAVTTGAVVEVPISLTTSQNQSALGFSIQFDTSKLRFLDVKLGGDAQQGFLNVNALEAALGYVGIAIAFPNPLGVTGENLELVTARFEAVSEVVEEVTLSFVDRPIVREVVTSEVEETLTSFVPGTIRFIKPVLLNARLLGDGQVEISWDASPLAGSLKCSGGINGSAWEPVSSPAERIGDRMVVRIARSSGAKFYKLFQP